MRQYNYKIYNIAGVLVMQDVIDSERNLISLKDLDPGIYIVHISSLNDDYSSVQKIMIDKSHL
jgi:hypothetical protein